MDIAKVYFSPRLATERYRVCQAVCEGEVVLDMFAGIGPFSILIAKHSLPSRIYAIDMNQTAIEYLRRNTERNKISIITPILGDAALEAPKLDANRIIMNLPHSSFVFLEQALGAAKRLATLHYYEILERKELEPRIEQLVSKARSIQKKIKIMATREVHTYSPSQNMYAIDILVLQ